MIAYSTQKCNADLDVCTRILRTAFIASKLAFRLTSRVNVIFSVYDAPAGRRDQPMIHRVLNRGSGLTMPGNHYISDISLMPADGPLVSLGFIRYTCGHIAEAKRERFPFHLPNGS